MPCIKLGKGILFIGPRPLLSAVSNHEIPAGVIITLQKESEGACQVGSVAEMHGYGWRHFPCSAWHIHWQSKDKMILAATKELKKLLDEGASVFVHCREGKHRSGTVAVNCMRMMGLSPETACSALSQLRPELESLYKKELLH